MVARETGSDQVDIIVQHHSVSGYVGGDGLFLRYRVKRLISTVFDARSGLGVNPHRTSRRSRA